MNIATWILASVIGYLVGSFSGARFVVWITGYDNKIDGIRMEIPGSDKVFESDVISATTVRHHLGNKYGCLTSILDIIKAALPALLFRLWQPDQYYYLAAAGMATVGHIWPVYHRFIGGRGMSPILGGMLVVDWSGVIVTQLIGGTIGMVSKKLFLIVGAGFALMIPWTWFRTGSWPEVVYLAAMNILFWIALVPEAKEINKIQGDGGLDQFMATERSRMFNQGEDQADNMPALTDVKAWIRILFPKGD